MSICKVQSGLILAAIAAPIVLTACSGGYETMQPSVGMRQAAARAAAPAPRIAYREPTAPQPQRTAGGYKLGSPYKIGSVWYVPREEPNYDRTGVGSWYGADFHGRQTANGEIYNMDALTAAHPTLPLPSYVTVTNLANNRTLLVRVNDRGPYVGGRLIDLSRASARALGYDTMGTANLRVQYGGRAPLNGDDTRERRYLAAQPWTRNLTAQAAPSAPAWQPRAAAAQPVFAPQPGPDGWSPDTYRRQAAKPSTDRQTAAPSSWLPSWGLGNSSP